MTEINSALNYILQIFNDSANEKLAVGMKAYLKNNFEFFGIKTTERREICKPVLKECKSLTKKETIDLAKILWQQPQRECHYLAQELLFQNLKKNISKEDIEWMEWFIINQSWWDTVDFIAPKLIALYFKKYPQQRNSITTKWINSKNIWLIRSAILFQLKYKGLTDVDFMFKTILSVSSTKEFFINKAIGWILRENAKRIPDEIQKFIFQNEKQLSNLSKREAIKNLN